MELAEYVDEFVIAETEKPPYKITDDLDHQQIMKCPYQDYGILCRRSQQRYVTNITGREEIGWGQNCHPDLVHNFAEIILKSILGQGVSNRIEYVLHFASAIVSSMPEEGGRIPIEEVIYWFDNFENL